MRTNNQNVGQVLKDVVRELRLGAKLTQAEIRSLWTRELGPVINRHTTELLFRAGTLVVRVDSAALRQELHYNRAALAKRLNEHLSAGEIREIEVR